MWVRRRYPPAPAPSARADYLTLTPKFANGKDFPRTGWTCRVPDPVLIGRAVALLSFRASRAPCRPRAPSRCSTLTFGRTFCATGHRAFLAGLPEGADSLSTQGAATWAGLLYSSLVPRELLVARTYQVRPPPQPKRIGAWPRSLDASLLSVLVGCTSVERAR